MSDNKVFYIACLCVAVSVAFIWKLRCSGTKPPFPPGPKRLPLLGNILDVPQGVPIWQTFTSLGKKFNTNVLYLRLLSTDMIVLSDPEVITDLLVERSNKYSGRRPSPMIDLLGLSAWNIAVLEYGNRWREGRRVLHEFLNVRAVDRFDEYQRKHTKRLLLRLAESPQDYLRHIEFFVGALSMEMAYGLNITDPKDKFLRASVESLDLANRALTPGTFLVDTVPILKYVPEWFPGAGFKIFARKARQKMDTVADQAVDHVAESIKSGGSENVSIAWSCLDQASERSSQVYDRSTVRDATGTIFMGAVDTTTTILRTFFLAMALNPHVVAKAQEGLDRVVGSERLPEFSDQEHLPYIAAVTKEVIRWGCPLPIGLPKCSTKNDIYNDHFIPAGATVAENVWAMFYDESVYPAPYNYDPERYLKNGKLDPSVRDPETRAFGSGRRACPGQHFALRTLFLNFACILAVFDIEVPAGEKLETRFSEDTLFRSPVPFKCTIRPRSEASLELIRSVFVAA